MQLLKKVGLKEKYESVLWGYLNTTISQSVAEYQVEPEQTSISTSSNYTPFSSEELGERLTKAVEGRTPTQVCYFARGM